MKEIKISKLVALAVSLMLFLNLFAGLSLTSFAASGEPGWIWYPAKDGYTGLNNMTASDASDSSYTTFTVSAADAYVYPGVNAGALPVLGGVDADSNKALVIRYRTSAVGAVGSVLLDTDATLTSVAEFACLNYSTDGEWHELVCDMSSSSGWDGADNQFFRVDALNNLSSGSIDIEYIALFATTDDANTWLDVQSEITPNWSWYPAADGYCATSSMTGVDVGDYTTFTRTGADAYTYPGTAAGDLANSGLGSIDAGTNKYMVIKYSVTADTGAYGCLLYGAAGHSATQNIYYTNDSDWHTDVIDLSDVAAWEGTINWFRFDAFDDNVATAAISLEYIALFATAEDADTWINGGTGSEEDPAPGELTAYHTSVDSVRADGAWSATGHTGSASSCYDLPSAVTVTTDFGFDGWMSTANGIEKYQYSLDGETYTDLTVTISAMPESAMPYGGAATAHFNMVIPASVLAMGTNTVIIRAIDTVGNWADIITATIVREAVTYAITTETCTNGTVKVDKSSAEAGETVTVTASPDIGYELASIFVDGEPITGNTFTVSGDHTVTATFTLKAVTFKFSLDTFAADGVDIAPRTGGEDTVTYSSSISVQSALVLGGWCSTTNGISNWQYCVNGGAWIDANAAISERADLVSLGYEGAATAGFTNLSIPASALAAGNNTVEVRFIDTVGNALTMIKFTSVTKVETSTVVAINVTDTIYFKLGDVFSWKDAVYTLTELNGGTGEPNSISAGIAAGTITADTTGLENTNTEAQTITVVYSGDTTITDTVTVYFVAPKIESAKSTQIYYEEGATFDITNNNVSIVVSYNESTTGIENETITSGIEIVTAPTLVLATDAIAATQDVVISYNGSAEYIIEDAVVVVDFTEFAKVLVGSLTANDTVTELLKLSVYGTDLVTSDYIAVRNIAIRK